MARWTFSAVIGISVSRTHGGIADGVADGGSSGDDRRLADAAHAERPGPRWDLQQDRLDRGHLHRRGQGIVEQAAGLDPALPVEHHPLVERPADPLHHTAVDLVLDAGRVDGLADVLDGEVVDHPRLVGIGIDADPRQVDGDTGGALGDARAALAGDGRVLAVLGGAEGADPGQPDAALRRAPDLDLMAGDLQVVRRDFELIAGDRHDLSSSLLGRFDDGGADGERDLAAAGVAGERPGLGVGVDDADLVGRDAERLGGHQDQAGVGAGDVHRADDNGQAAIAFEPARGRRRLQAAEQAADGDADTFIGALVPRLPGGVFLQALQALPQPDLRPGPAVRHWVALFGDVLEAQLNGIELKLARQLVHGRFEGEHRLRTAGSAVGTGRDGVGDDGVPPNAEAREAVEGAGVERGVGERAAVVEAGVDDDPGVQGGQGAVALRADLHVHLHPGSRIGGLELVHAGEDDPHGPVVLDGEGGSEDLGQQAFAAEPAADDGRGDADAVLRPVERFGDLLTGQEDAVAGRVDAEAAERIDAGGDGVGLEVALVDDRGGVRALDHDVGLGEPGRDVAPVVAGVISEVRGAEGGIAGVVLDGFGTGDAVRPDGGSIGRDGRAGIDNGRQFLVLDLDQGDGVLGGGLAFGDDGGDGLAAEAGDASGERLARPGGGRRLDDGREVVRRDHADDAGVLQRLAGIDLDDPGVGVEAGDEPGVQQAVERQIVAEAGLPGHLLRAIDAWNALAEGGLGRDADSHDWTLPWSAGTIAR